MAAVNFTPRNAATYVGIEATYGTTPAMTRATIVEGSFEPDAQQTEIDVPDERAHIADLVDPVLGLKTGGGCKFAMHCRPPATQLTATTTEAHYLGLVLKALFGGESATGGTLVASATSATVFTVTAGQGVRIAEGQTILVAINGALEPARVKSVATDTITLAYALSATPAAGALVVGMYNYFLTQTNTQSLCVQHAKVQDADHQWTFNGCTGGLELTTERDQVFKITAALKAGTFTGPSAQGIGTATAAESMGKPIAFREYFCLLQPVATATRTHRPIESVGVELQFGMEHIPELAAGTGGVEGTVGVMRAGAVKPFAKVKLKMRADTQLDAWWSSRTPLQFVLAVPTGSGTTKRWAVLDVGTCLIVGKPKHPGGDRQLYELELHAQLDTSTSGSTSDQALSPTRLCIG